MRSGTSGLWRSNVNRPLFIWNSVLVKRSDCCRCCRLLLLTWACFRWRPSTQCETAMISALEPERRRTSFLIPAGLFWAKRRRSDPLLLLPHRSTSAGRPLWRDGGSCTDARATTTSSQVHKRTHTHQL